MVQKARPSGSELALWSLSKKLPEQYHAWLRGGIACITIGYALALLSLLYEQGLSELPRLREPYVIACGLIAMECVRRGHLRTAAFVSLGAVWLELHLTLMLAGVRTPPSSVLVVATTGAALFLGTRIAMVAALSAVLTVPLFVWLGSLLGVGPGFQRGDLIFVVALLISMVTMAYLLSLFTNAFENVLRSLETNRQRARELVDDAPDVIIALNGQGVIEDFNPAAERLLGVPRGEAVGMRFDELPLVSTAIEERASSLERQTIPDVPREYEVTSTGKTLEGLFRRVTRADGTSGSLLWLRDVTARRSAEERALELQQQLQHAQKLKALGQLAGGVSHDFNNLLTTVGGYGDLLHGHADLRVRQVANELAATRERGTALTRQLLTFARKEVAQPLPVDVSEVLWNMESLLRRVLGESIELELSLAGHAVVFIDPGQMQQVILNLVMNAKDAMPDGGRLSIQLVGEANSVKLRIADTGSGMDEETRARIFEPFFTTKARGQGTGLGLSTVFGTLSSANAKIDVSSAPGLGTTFTLTFPRHGAALDADKAHDAAQADEAEAQVAELPARHSLSPEPATSTEYNGHLLVAEDDPQGRRLLKALLVHGGYRVTACESGAAAIEAFDRCRQQNTPIDLLISDVRMPEMTGPELALSLKQRDPGLPVLFISGYFEPELDGVTFNPSEDLLPKPYTEAELRSRIEKKLRRDSQTRIAAR